MFMLAHLDNLSLILTGQINFSQGQILFYFSIKILSLKIQHLTHLSPTFLLMGHRQTVKKPDQMPQKAASDQIMHCLLKNVLLKFE